MKLKCVVAPTEWEPELGIATVDTSSGLTVGRIYEGQAIVSGTNLNLIRFLIYNDNNEWKLYDKKLFKPK